MATLQRAVFVAMSVQEIICETAIEGLAQVGFEGIGDAALRGTPVVVGAFGTKGVEALTIGGDDVFHIGDILQPSLYLERNRSGIGQLFQRVDATHVLQRQQMALVLNLTTVGIQQVVLHTTHLGTFTTIGRPPQTVLRHVALSAIAHTQRSMHKHLELHIGHLPMNLANLLQRQLTCQNHTAEAK